MANNLHTLFILGAGASIPVLPITSGIEMAAKTFIEQINEYKRRLSFRDFPNKTELNQLHAKLDDLLADIHFLRDACEKHISIDTAAKKYLSRDNVKLLSQIKQGLTDLFSFIQFTQPSSTRYDAFIAALYDHHNRRMPDQVKIISWNYDVQFELAFSEYYNQISYRDIATGLNLTPHSNRTPSIGSFFLHKMNGSAAYFDNSNNQELAPLFPTFNLDRTVKRALETIISNRTNSYKNNIRFAFETKINKNELVPLRDSISNCVNLVVIGYSFPFFNRDYDNFVFAQSNFENIYVQCPQESFAD
ncbi:MAG: hypothetical protein KA193_12970, partial [Bacteroidia bacterium]|nr:hypothetical protein [Bacteroidia bacterium]